MVREYTESSCFSPQFGCSQMSTPILLWPWILYPKWNLSLWTRVYWHRMWISWCVDSHVKFQINDLVLFTAFCPSFCAYQGVCEPKLMDNTTPWLASESASCKCFDPFNGTLCRTGCPHTVAWYDVFSLVECDSREKLCIYSTTSMHRGVLCLCIGAIISRVLTPIFRWNECRVNTLTTTTTTLILSPWMTLIPNKSP